jgi:hypothetical protein
MTKMSGLSELSVADVADLIAVGDASAGQTKKMTVLNFIRSLVGGVKSNNIDLSVADATARAALTPFEGMLIYRKDTDAIEIYDGSAWLTFDSKWQTYTPDVYTNNSLWTKGNGIASGRYFRRGKNIEIEFFIQVGSTTTWNGSGTHEITLPAGTTLAALLNAGVAVPRGQGRHINSGIGEAVTGIFQSSTNPTTRLVATTDQYGATSQNNTFITSSSPFTSGQDDVMCGYGVFPLS